MQHQSCCIRVPAGLETCCATHLVVGGAADGVCALAADVLCEAKVGNLDVAGGIHKQVLRLQVLQFPRRCHKARFSWDSTCSAMSNHVNEVHNRRRLLTCGSALQTECRSSRSEDGMRCLSDCDWDKMSCCDPHPVHGALSVEVRQRSDDAGGAPPCVVIQQPPLLVQPCQQLAACSTKTRTLVCRLSGIQCLTASRFQWCNTNALLPAVDAWSQPPFSQLISDQLRHVEDQSHIIDAHLNS